MNISVTSNGEPHDLESSMNTIRVLYSIRKRWRQCMAHKGGREIHTWFWLGILKDLQDLSRYSTTILKWISRHRLIWLTKKTSGRLW